MDPVEIDPARSADDLLADLRAWVRDDLAHRYSAEIEETFDQLDARLTQGVGPLPREWSAPPSWRQVWLNQLQELLGLPEGEHGPDEAVIAQELMALVAMRNAAGVRIPLSVPPPKPEDPVMRNGGRDDLDGGRHV